MSATKNAFDQIERIYSVNTYLRISLSHEGVREVSERARERSQRSEVERCGASERREGERTNVASDRLAR